MRDRQLCFGGSFNPIHFGHLRCAQAAANARGFDTVVLVPSAQPPHKPASADLAPAEDRLAMTKLAAESMTGPPKFQIEDLETRRTGPSYTIDTVNALLARGWPQVWWLIGADMLNYLPMWRSADQLVKKCNFLILARPGVRLDWEKLPPHFVERLRPNVVPAPLIDISATDIRRRVREGESIDGLTPASVVEHIRTRGLYRSAGTSTA
jgi:nicotinate-nucleotide adenylyltransferase